MTYSRNTATDNVLKAWTASCVATTQSANTFYVDDQECFFEVSRIEHDDGAVTGSTWRVLNRDDDQLSCRRAGTFRIDADGSVSRGPKSLREAAAARLKH